MSKRYRMDTLSIGAITTRERNLAGTAMIEVRIPPERTVGWYTPSAEVSGQTDLLEGLARPDRL